MKTILSQWWGKIQGSLFPWLEEELGPLSEKHLQVIKILEMARVEEHLPETFGHFGRPKKDRTAIARAFVVKSVYNFPTTRSLLDRLQCDIVLRRICGWESLAHIPDESTFSRAFAEFSRSQLPERVHEALIKKITGDRIVGHISRDSTAIESREKPLYEKKVKKKLKKRGRPKKGEERPKELKRLDRQRNMTIEEMLEDLPKKCDIGAKKNSKGHTVRWIGYKYHIDTMDGDIPVSAILTSASLHDSQVALPLGEKSNSKIVNLYDLMDAAYDAWQIQEHSRKLGHVPIIDANPRGDLPQKEAMKAEKTAQRILNLEYPEDNRYKQRSSAERVNARLKDEFGGRMLRVRGGAKVACHLMFGLLALTADQVFRLLM